MSRRSRLAALATLAASLIACGETPAPVATEVEWSVWLLRHAEKADDGTRDPPLNAVGTSRAATLAAEHASAGIDALWTTDYRRTRDTLAPLAETTGLPLRTYDPRAPEALVATLRNEARDAMVVGHSNTIPDLTARLCGCRVEPMDETEYGRIARVRFTGDRVSLETRFDGLPPAMSEAGPAIDGP